MSTLSSPKGDTGEPHFIQTTVDDVRMVTERFCSILCSQISSDVWICCSECTVSNLVGQVNISLHWVYEGILLPFGEMTSLLGYIDSSTVKFAGIKGQKDPVFLCLLLLKRE